MIPVRLNLRNFMCYTDVHEPLVFDGIRVACLSGSNGHGKSALLDAVTWALWGRSRARTADELIHSAPGCTEMEVEFDFLLSEALYRVIRKRSKKSGGKSALDVFVRDAASGEFRALSGNNIAETERLIQSLLKMSYETFTNSSFVLQGRADSFTVKTPGERKQILAEILDLSYYDRLEERARRLVAERNEQHTVLRQQLQDDDAELEQCVGLRLQLEQLEAEATELEERLRLEEARVEVLRERLNRLRAGERERQELERRLERARAEAARFRRQAAAAEAALERARAILAREAVVEQGHAELRAKRAELDTLATTRTEHDRLTYEALCLQRIVEQEWARLEGRRKQLEAQLAELEGVAQRVEQLGAELAGARAERDELEQLEARWADLRTRVVETAAGYREAESFEQHYTGQLAVIRERRDLLGASPVCPVCKTQLGAEGHRHVVRQFETEERGATAKLEQYRRQMEELKTLGQRLKAELARLGQPAERRKQNGERIARAEAALGQAQERARSAEGLRRELGEVERALHGNAYAPAERQELVRLERAVMTLGYDRPAHDALTAAVEELVPFEAQHRALDEARRSLTREQEARAEAERGLAEWEAEARADEQRRAELLAETKDLPSVESEFTTAESDLRAQRRCQGDLTLRLGGVRQRLNTMDFVEQRRAARRAELDRVLKERSIYQQLVEAFGKKGLQAVLIETAIPEIQDEANRLLEIMTDGRMHVTFKTQRAARGGDIQIETLDIIIRDELGERAYEMYSGGEAFRVNFAIRIALSKLLARRAGAKLQLLVIDEGFGSQDDQGRDRLVDAIRAIQPEFEKILIVTHLSDLKDVFDTRIEVTKTPAGSIIEVA